MAAAMAAAGDPPGDPPLAGLVLLDAWNAGADARQLRAGGPQARAAFLASLGDCGHALGPITPSDVADGLIRRGEAWDLAAAAPKLAHGCPDPASAAQGTCRRLPILTVWAAHGLAADNKALAEALRGAGAPVTAVVLDTDQAFTDSRIRLAAEVAAWLQALDARR